MDEVNPAPIIAELRDLANSGDVEAAHQQADEILCELLTRLGYADVVTAWGNVPKWYA